MLADALLYPFRGAGLLIMILGTVLAIVLQIVSLAPFVGIIALLIFYGYFTAYYYQILQQSASGSDLEPDWPDVSDYWDDAIRPVIQVLGVLLVSNSLWFLAVWQLGEESPVTWLAEMLGMFYFPMAILGVVTLGHIGGANPLLVIPSIFKTLPRYAVVAAIAIALPLLLDAITQLATSNPYLSWGLSTFLTLYLITAHARLLGLFYQRNEEKLDWI